jgi:hypothetical protein
LGFLATSMSHGFILYNRELGAPNRVGAAFCRAKVEFNGKRKDFTWG